MEMASRAENDSAPGSGAFTVALRAVTWESRKVAPSAAAETEPVEADEEGAPVSASGAASTERAVWGFVQVLLPPERPLERVWFSGEDQNMFTKSLVLPTGRHNDDGPDHPPLAFDYSQSSRAVSLTSESLQEVGSAQLRVSLYAGASRTRASSTLLASAQVPLLAAILGSSLQKKVQLSASEDTFTLDLSVQCDANLADFALGARALRLCSPRVLHLPPEWTLQSCTTNEEALRACEAADQNAACYELDIALPQLEVVQAQEDNNEEDGGEADQAAPLYHFEVLQLKGGKLRFKPTPPGEGDTPLPAEETKPSDGAGDNEEEGRPASPVASISGEWSVCFPETATVCKLYFKHSMERLLEFLTVEKHVSGTLRRTGSDNSSGKALDVVSADFHLNLHDLLAPGKQQALVHTPLRTVSPIPRAVLEQELAAAVSNDEKKKFQTALADYDTMVQQAATLSSAVVTAETQVEGLMEVLYSPLVLRAPEVLEPPSRSISELISPRDLATEQEQRHDVLVDLRGEIRLAVATLLREYEEVFRPSGDKKLGEEDSTADTVIPRDEKKQTLIYRLNTQGVYHSFKEALKTRIVAVIRERFARSDVATEEEEDGGQQQQPEEKTVDEKKKEQFGQIYALVMDEVHTILHDTFYSDSDALLEKAQAGSEGRPAPKEVASVLEELRLKAMENEVSGDIEKSEMLHLDRIAFAEQHAAQVPTPPQPQKQASTEAYSAVQLLLSVWYEYARFCVAQAKLEKAGAALQQCVRLDTHALRPLLALVALQCELGDYAKVEVLVKNAVAEAQVEENTDVANAEETALAHALLAFYFTQFEGKDPTGNLTLFELLRAQQVLQNNSSGAKSSQTSCVSAVWVFLAEYAHEWKMRRLTRTALQLSERHRKPRDVFSAEQRIMKRAIEAELCVLGVEGLGNGESGSDRAVKLLEEALEIDASHPLAWLTLGKVYLQRETQTEAAIECLQRALEHRDALHAEELRLALYLRLGLALLHSSQFEAAEATFLQACDEFRVASSWLGVGIASLRLERWERAQMALAEANRLDASNPDVWGYLALFALTAHAPVSARDEQDAQQFVAQALRYDLSSPALLRELSNAFVAIDRLESAEKLLRRSLVCQDSSLTRKTLADVLAAQNFAEDALRQYTQSLDATEDLAERCVLLEKCAQLLTTLGRPEEASEYRTMAKQFQTEKA